MRDAVLDKPKSKTTPAHNVNPAAHGSRGFQWTKKGNQIVFTADAYCAVFFENPAFFGKTYVRLEAGVEKCLDIAQPGSQTGFFVLPLQLNRYVSDPPPIT